MWSTKAMAENGSGLTIGTINDTLLFVHCFRCCLNSLYKDEHIYIILSKNKS